MTTPLVVVCLLAVVFAFGLVALVLSFVALLIGGESRTFLKVPFLTLSTDTRSRGIPVRAEDGDQQQKLVPKGEAQPRGMPTGSPSALSATPAQPRLGDGS